MMMKKLLFSVMTIPGQLLMVQSAHAQSTPLPYYENFDSLASTRWQTYELGTSDADDFPWYITIHNPYSPAFSMMHTCTNGTPQANNWTVSKIPFSFAAGGKIDSIRSWITATNTPAAGDTIGIYLLTGNNNPDLATGKILLHDFRDAAFETDSWIRTTDITIPPTTEPAYIAFRYKTADNCINIFLDNMHLSGNAPTSLHDAPNVGIDFLVTPNPVTNSFTIQSKQQVEFVNIYNVMGQKVYTHLFQPTIDISSLPRGTYILEVIDANKKKMYKRIVKQ